MLTTIRARLSALPAAATISGIAKTIREVDTRNAVQASGGTAEVAKNIAGVQQSAENSRTWHAA
jgi:hypothetical protein